MGDVTTLSPLAISPDSLISLVGSADLPVLYDVRRRPVYDAEDTHIPTARWREHVSAEIWGRTLDPARRYAVYCVHGHQVSQIAATHLRALGLDAYFIDGGIEAWREAGGPTIRKSALPDHFDNKPSQWVTRERPKIDRIACPWFIRRFVDRDAIIHYVPKDWIVDAAAEMKAIPFDIPDVDFSHVGEACSFDAFLARFGVDDPALLRLAEIVRGADTACLDLAPQASGLLAMSLGLSAIHGDDRRMLEAGMTLYDALYGWCRHAADETHNWPVPPRNTALSGEQRV